LSPEDWVVEVVGHKLATHHPVIEPVSTAEPVVLVGQKKAVAIAMLGTAAVVEAPRMAGRT
jgi:hypothetical protein